MKPKLKKVSGTISDRSLRKGLRQNGVRFTYPFEALPALGSNKANPLEMEWLAV